MATYRRYHDEDERDNKTILHTLYREDYAVYVENELKRLVRPYGTDARLGKAHPAQCSSWRAERSLQDPAADWDTRFSNRIHLFAGTRDGLDDDPFPDNSLHSEEEESLAYPMAQTQRYLGYLSLRPLRDKIGKPFHLHYTTVAMLIPPPYMLRPRFHIITTIVGSADGILPFRAAPFFNPASPQNRQGGPLEQAAPCMHAALHSALMLKATLFHCRPISSVEMVTLLWQMNHAPNYPFPRRPTPPLNFYGWLKEGLSLEQALAVLQHKEVRGGGIVEYILDHTYLPAQKKYVALEALRCLADYIANGIPVLIEIKPPKMRQQRGHAILVIGMRLMADPDDVRWPLPDDDHLLSKRMDLKELPSKFVIHDASKGPYEVVSASHLLSRAYIPGKETTEETTEGGIRFLALMPMHTRLGVQNVRKYAQMRFADWPYSSTYEDYLRLQLHWDGKTPKFPPPSKTGRALEYRFVCRLMRSRQILHRYLRAAPNPSGQGTPELTAAKAALKERLNLYQEEYNRQVRETICDNSEKIETISLHWWCVEIRTPTQMQAAGNRAATEERVIPPLIVYFWPVNMDPQMAAQGPPIRIEYSTGDQAALVLRTQYAPASSEEDAIVTVFPQWRPSDG